MGWLRETRIVESVHNGRIVLRRRLGRWHISVNGYEESGPYLNAIWRDAFRYIKKPTMASPKVLMLGLGAGSSIPDVHHYLPGCTIDAVEHDPAMTDLCKELRLYEPFPAPNVFTGDAQALLPTLPERYDLILVDLFHGNEPPPFLKEPAFLSTMGQLLRPGGKIILNVCRFEEFLQAADRTLLSLERWRYQSNLLGSYGISV